MSIEPRQLIRQQIKKEALRKCMHGFLTLNKDKSKLCNIFRFQVYVAISLYFRIPAKQERTAQSYYCIKAQTFVKKSMAYSYWR